MIEGGDWQRPGQNAGVSAGDSTVWTVIRGAAAGDAAARDAFGKAWLPFVRAYLCARWAGTPLIGEVDDAVQEVFVDLFKPNGALHRVESDRPGGFRAYLCGMAKTAALHAETRRARQGGRMANDPPALDALPADDEAVSRAFDRAWARALVVEAAGRMREGAARDGDAALRRVDLLRLRFQERLPIREIAALWEVESAWLHHQYARARREFLVSLEDVVQRRHEGTKAEVRRECERLLGFFA